MLMLSVFFFLFFSKYVVNGISADNVPHQYRIVDKIMRNYKPGVIPKQENSINVTFSMELYQIIEMNEPQQSIRINAWIKEKWVDGMLGWDPEDYGNVSELTLPHSDVWVPDTTLYNSLDMSTCHEDQNIHVQLVTCGKSCGAQIRLLYPKIYLSSCLLDLRYFPFDVQVCTFTFGSWSFDNTFIDYSEAVIGVSNCLENDGWNLLATNSSRVIKKYDCCPNNYTLLELKLKLGRKPLYYIVNLIFPTGVITFISILGFFTSSSINDLRQEKITLGITTLLSMSILIFMVSDQMPSTSSFVPLIGWFYTSMIVLISLGTLFASLVIFIQKQGILGKYPDQKYLKITKRFARAVGMEMPLVMKQAYWKKESEEKLKRSQRRKSIWKRVNKLSLSSFKAQGPLNEVQLQPESIVKDHSAPILGKFGTEFEDPMTCSTTTDISIENGKSLVDVLKPIEISITPFNTRNLPQLEWDFIAAVFERICLIVFVILFFLCAVGINCIGYYHWKIAKSRDVYNGI